MRRLASLLLVGFLVGIIFFFASAKDHMAYNLTSEKKPSGTGYCNLSDKNRMKEAARMSSKMMKSMMSKAVAATEDGGFVVVVGDKILKYDKDLNLVKEVVLPLELEMDWIDSIMGDRAGSSLEKNLSEQKLNQPKPMKESEKEKMKQEILLLAKSSNIRIDSIELEDNFLKVKGGEQKPRAVFVFFNELEDKGMEVEAQWLRKADGENSNFLIHCFMTQ